MSDPNESEVGSTPPNKGAGGGRRPSACSRLEVPSTSDHILAGAMEKLAESIVSQDGLANAAMREAGQRITELSAEVKKWKKNIIPFLGIHAGIYGRDRYGEGGMHYTHYDMLREAGARMDSFTRCGDPSSEND